MNIKDLTAEMIAERQLLAALDLYRREDYVSALTLAGAAEEILGKRLRELGRKPSFDRMRELIGAVALQDGTSDAMPVKTAGEMLVGTYNLLKHHSDDKPISIDIHADCLDVIHRAHANYQALTGSAMAEAMHILATTDENRRLRKTEKPETK